MNSKLEEAVAAIDNAIGTADRTKDFETAYALRSYLRKWNFLLSDLVAKDPLNKK